MERGFMPPGTKRYKDKRFMFDRVFDNQARQQDVYEATAQPLLQGLLKGTTLPCSRMAQLAVARPTISGTETDPGIIYMTVADLFQRIEDRRDEWNVEGMVTFLEIYNEEIRDLLSDPGTPAPRGSAYLTGLTDEKTNVDVEAESVVGV
ncbi:kinesin motor domain-containing protein [Mycena olivaceomarginata]|nr:kinesin motor domain-containing protein [Mycena olivaceomarginata]